ncbi:hypothetical protein DFJ77DRAFT_512075 [Powellomyces hirtus]|nr:hypothetical protein DFJ77DRAFT_512075 [Powellomyces hirtus]
MVDDEPLDLYSDDSLVGRTDNLLYDDLLALSHNEEGVGQRDDMTLVEDDVLSFGMNAEQEDSVAWLASELDKDEQGTETDNPQQARGSNAHSVAPLDQPGAKPLSQLVDQPSPTPKSSRNAIVVGDLTWWTSDEDLQTVAQDAGVGNDLIFTELTFHEHKVNGKSRGVAYMAFTAPEAAHAAKKLLGMIEIHGRKPTVTMAEANQRKNPFRTTPREKDSRSITTTTTSSIGSSAYSSGNSNTGPSSSAAAAAGRAGPIRTSSSSSVPSPRISPYPRSHPGSVPTRTNNTNTYTLHPPPPAMPIPLLPPPFPITMRAIPRPPAFPTGYEIHPYPTAAPRITPQHYPIRPPGSTKRRHIIQ